jgi:ATP synthase protein I
MERPTDDRAGYAIASHWVSRIMTVSLEMVLPGMVGLWLDRRLSTPPLLTMVGFGVGMTMAIWHLLQLVKHGAGRRKTEEEPRPPDQPGGSN